MTKIIFLTFVGLICFAFCSANSIQSEIEDDETLAENFIESEDDFDGIYLVEDGELFRGVKSCRLIPKPLRNTVCNNFCMKVLNRPGRCEKKKCKCQ
ncbi:CLUMA_CG001135, isoform A [Clunio marinus]|uniref:CLUMA_CG001135, isoform A n=1 Tax=Clunio marinus TaxID=568069 RepID=A0A1J1HH53_9DIPT|nr:CLUMA_CG001135, isoform A [Clunio marinus]